MTAPIGFYTPGTSWLNRLDPRPKLWIALLGILICLFSTRIDILAITVVIAHLTLLLGGIPASRLFQVWQRLAILLIVILILQPIISPGPEPPIVQIGPIHITASGLLLGLRYALRVTGAAFFALIPVMTTPVNVLVRGLQKIGLPYVWGAAIGLALRYLGTLGDLYTTILEGQATRGWDVTSGGIIQRARAAAPALIALTIASLRLADSLALAMAARGFGMPASRTWRHDIAMKPIDWFAIILATIIFATLLSILLILN
jgi:energy-coupling factor transport system permease protein